MNLLKSPKEALKKLPKGAEKGPFRSSEGRSGRASMWVLEGYQKEAWEGHYSYL